jgi:hypothetical protein
VPLPPDDLPRSPTGRVPRWVVDLDEATGHSPVNAGLLEQHSRGRYPRSRPVVVGRQRPVVRRRFLAALLATVVAAGVTVAMSPDRGAALGRSVADWAQDVGRRPLPPASSRTFAAPGHEEQPTRILAAPVLPGTGAGYAFSGTQDPVEHEGSDNAGSPVTWSPCRPIHYVVNPAGAPAGFAGEVGRAVAEVSAATGLAFVDDGGTTESPRDRREPFQYDRYGDRWAPILIGFTDAATVPDLAGDVAGVGGAVSLRDPRTRTVHYVSGIVYLDVDVLSVAWSGSEPVYLPILRHELGHLVGLAHTDDSSQLMHAINQGRSGFQPGDLAGLAAVGRGPCAPGV